MCGTRAACGALQRTRDVAAARADCQNFDGTRRIRPLTDARAGFYTAALHDVSAAMPDRSRIAIVYLLGFAIDLANMFMLNAAYPALQRELHASVAQLAWVGNMYVLGLTVVIPFGTWLARRCGERRVFAASLLLFSRQCGRRRVAFDRGAARMAAGPGRRRAADPGRADDGLSRVSAAGAGAAHVDRDDGRAAGARVVACDRRGHRRSRVVARDLLRDVADRGRDLRARVRVAAARRCVTGRRGSTGRAGLSAVALVALLLGLTAAGSPAARHSAGDAGGGRRGRRRLCGARRALAPVVDLRLLAQPLLRAGVVVICACRASLPASTSSRRSICRMRSD